MLPEIVILYGLTGVGKSRALYETLPQDTMYHFRGHFPPGHMFEGYAGETSIAIDTFIGFDHPDHYEILMRIIGDQPISVLVNKRSRHMLTTWNHVYITAYNRPEEWFPQRSVIRRNAFLSHIIERGHVYHLTEHVNDFRVLPTEVVHLI